MSTPDQTDQTTPPPPPEAPPEAPPEVPPETPQSDELESLRRRIDEVDERLVELLSERAEIVVRIGATKRDSGAPIYAPHREQAVLAKAITANPGPLSARTIEAIYRELMSGSFSLELPLRVGYLGPPGSFSHIAAVRHFGSSVECADLHAIAGVFEEVAAGHCHYGLVPYENSIGGGVTDTLDSFREHEVTIYAEALIEVNHTFLANCAPNDVERIYSKREVLGQCRRWLGRQYPNADLIETDSSATAVRHAAEEAHAAAIGSTLAGEIYGAKPLFENVQDRPNNITRFLVIGREEAEPTGSDKTTLMFVTADRPGALVDVLGVFRDASINLSHIDKRPSGRTNWEYTFFIDCEAHRHDATMAAAIKDARRHCVSLKVLGSYPRARRIL
ncbi:MAG: prephenate dehydratase [Planctomycetota bacterium]|jgi:chorismate mutase/prephenate dehydratase